jgi:hypothetical protein
VVRDHVVKTGGPHWRFLVVAVATLTSAVTAVWAQTVQDATLTGIVILQTGDVLEGAVATVTSDSLVTGSRLTISNARGTFVFLGLPPGSYDLIVYFEGFRTFSQENITLATGTTVHVDIPLEMGAVEDTLVVTAEAPLIDARSSTIDTTFSLEMLEVVPTARSVLFDLPLAAAGMANVGQHDGWIRGPSAHGGAINENIYLIDGVDITDPRGSHMGSPVNVNFDAVSEVKVLSLGARAEYPSFSGAAIDVQTKSGSNTFHGSLAYYAMIDAASNQRTSFGADWLWALEGDRLTDIPESSNEITASLGGPLVRDRVWFFAGVSRGEDAMDHRRLELHPFYSEDFYNLKLTAEPGRNHRAWLGYNHRNYTTGNQGYWTPTTDSTAVFNNYGDVGSWSAQYQWLASDRNILSFKALGFLTEDNTIPMPVTGMPAFVNYWQWGGFLVGGDYPFIDLWSSNRHTYQADLSHFADNLFGSHELKIGLQVTRAEQDYLGGFFHGYRNYARTPEWSQRPTEWMNGPDFLIMNNFQTHYNPFSSMRVAESTAGFIDDSWMIGDRLSLDFGLRYDHMTARYGEGAVYELPETPADVNHLIVQRERAGTGNIYDFRTWSPRVGLAWTVTGDGKTVLRTHLGRYYAPIGVESLCDKSGPGAPDVFEVSEWFAIPTAEVDVNGDNWVDSLEFTDAARSLVWRTPYQSRNFGPWRPSGGFILRVAPGTGNPYTDHFIVSVQRQLGRELSLEASYIYKKTDDLIVMWAIAPGGSELEWERIPYTTSTGTETEVYQVVLEDFDGDGVVDWNDFLCLRDEAPWEARNLESVVGRQADRTYNGLQFVLNKRFSNRWQMLASLNWTRGGGVAQRGVGQDFNIDGPVALDNFFGWTMNDFTNNLDGPLPMTPEFLFKLAGSYTIPVIETDLGFRVRADSGRAIFAVEELPMCQRWHGEFLEGRIVGLEDNDLIVASDPDDPVWMPSTALVDLSLAKSFSLGRYGDLRIIFDVLNILIDGGVNGVAYRQWDYGRVTSVVGPRVTRLGLRYSF